MSGEDILYNGSSAFKAVGTDCLAIRIPDGDPLILEKGTPLSIVQFLGGVFTVQNEEGNLFRLDGKYAHALGEEEELELFPQLDLTKPLEELVWEQLKTCYDPEIPVNIVELGLVYVCDITPFQEGYRVDIQMALTAPGCGMGDVMAGDIEHKLRALPQVVETYVELILDPPWDSSMMSEAARLQLGLW